MSLANWTDLQLANLPKLVFHIRTENENQLSKWGIQSRSPFEWLCYLTEEVGEVNKAIGEWFYRKGTRDEIAKEAIQVATLALKIAEMAMEGLNNEHKPNTG